MLALTVVKCQSSDVGAIRESDDGHVVVEGSERTLTYSARLVTLDDGTSVSHESQGGELASVWATDLGDFFVEVAHLGDGPVGGELVMTITYTGSDPDVPRHVAIGDLWADELPARVPPSWPVAVDLALGLIEGDTRLVGANITKDDVEQLHQRLLGALHG